MIDFKQELKNFTPIDLEKLKKADLNMPDNLKNSVLLYNKALDDLRTKSEDIAVIELKKAISLNPDFCEAINLLGLLYASMGDYAKAREKFEKVLGIEKNNKALSYMKVIDPNYSQSDNVNENKKGNGKNKHAASGKVKKTAATASPSKSSVSAIRQILKNDLVKYIIGFIAGLLVFFLINALINSGEAAPVISDYNNKPSANDNKEDFEQKYNDLNKEYKTLSQELDEFKKSTQNYSNTAKLLEIDKLVINKNYVAAADLLTALRTVEYKGIEKEKYDSLREQAMEKAANELFIQGKDLYKDKQFKKALDKFDRVTAYISEWKNSGATTYYRGVCLMETDNKQKALEALNEVISKYPSSSYAGYAKTRINSMN